MRGADILVEMLIGYGVETIFGVPGDTNVRSMKLCRIAKAKSGTSWPATSVPPLYGRRYGRFTNKPGVFECPSGAGAMYSLPPWPNPTARRFRSSS